MRGPQGQGPFPHPQKIEGLCSALFKFSIWNDHKTLYLMPIFTKTDKILARVNEFTRLSLYKTRYHSILTPAPDGIKANYELEFTIFHNRWTLDLSIKSSAT